MSAAGSTPPGPPASRSAVIPVLFVNSPEKPGADTFVHFMLMRSLDRTRFELHTACSPGTKDHPAPTLDVLSAIPDLQIRRSNFGPTLVGRSIPAKVIELLRGAPSLVADVVGLARYIRRHRIGILHSSDRPRDALACVLLGKLTGAKSLIHVHVKCSDWQSRPVRWAMTHADAVVGISRFVAQSIVDAGVRPGATHVVLNGIDPYAWDFRIDAAPVRREFDVPPGAPLVVCVARLFHWKGQADLVRAIALVRQTLPAVRLLIVGGDDRHASRESFSAELTRLAAELGLSDQVTLTGQRSDVAAFLAAADVFAMPSFEEPFGLVYLEAFAMKKPVVALDNGGTPEVVEHGRSGLLSAAGDVSGLAANLVRLLELPALRSEMGEHGRRQVETRFTMAQMTRKMEQLYVKLMGGERAA